MEVAGVEAHDVPIYRGEDRRAGWNNERCYQGAGYQIAAQAELYNCNEALVIFGFMIAYVSFET
jgi:hypothetical protein